MTRDLRRGLTGKQQWAIVLACVAVLGGVLFISTRLIGNEMFLVSIGSEAPQFHAATVGPTASVNRKMDDYRGSVVLLSVWATWCKPCIVEMPSIERLYQDYGPQGLKVVAISIDDCLAQRCEERAELPALRFGEKNGHVGVSGRGEE